MAVLTIRDVPDDLYAILKQLAARNRRSLQQEAIVQLEQARGRAGDSPLDRARVIRQQFAGRDLGDTVEEIRQERAR
ncbi:MAG: hypothetical protein EXR79_15760 [Myxococcales bacterium]|nr:hypothetical protein [Myxococcales bacterium]